MDVLLFFKKKYIDERDISIESSCYYIMEEKQEMINNLNNNNLADSIQQEKRRKINIWNHDIYQK